MTVDFVDIRAFFEAFFMDPDTGYLVAQREAGAPFMDLAEATQYGIVGDTPIGQLYCSLWLRALANLHYFFASL